VIGSANMDGSNVTVIQKAPRVKWPNGLTIDFQSNRLFWVDAQKDLVRGFLLFSLVCLQTFLKFIKKKLF